jgi:hypothetical protein
MYGRIVRRTAGILCNECLEILQMVQPDGLRRALDEMELQLSIAITLCRYCGAVNLFPGFSRVEVFVCQTCGKGNG